MKKKPDTNTPVLVLGGEENALALVRCLNKQHISVSIAAYDDCLAKHSFHTKKFYSCPKGDSIAEFWQALLITENTASLNNALIFPCSDEALVFLTKHKSELTKKYKLYDFSEQLICNLLDKQKTIDLANDAGIPAPKYWSISSIDDLQKVCDVTYPLMLKPKNTYEFSKLYGSKLLTANSLNELTEKSNLMISRNIDFIVCEIIHGPDTNLSSYYTYITQNNQNLFKYTKRIIRRTPVNYGGACYHISKWEKETARLGDLFFKRVGLQGMGNIEFKYDERDKQLKIIECNLRITAAHQLLVDSNMDIAYFIYCHVNNIDIEIPEKFIENKRLIDPYKDFLSFLELRRSKSITLFAWIKSIFYAAAFPYFSLTDPLPVIVRYYRLSFLLIKKPFKNK